MVRNIFDAFDLLIVYLHLSSGQRIRCRTHRHCWSYARQRGWYFSSTRGVHKLTKWQPLMRALAKLVAVNNPDKIIFVGEALVGNEAVDQLTKFDRALRDFSSASGAGKGRGIDGMLVTKWDTVDDKVSRTISHRQSPGRSTSFYRLEPHCRCAM
jgi:signal recognition particle receptor subunit alpha